jgi:hypothetical protein
MAIIYQGTTKPVETSEDAKIVLEDRDYMIYQMLKEILAELQRKRTTK